VVYGSVFILVYKQCSEFHQNICTITPICTVSYEKTGMFIRIAVRGIPRLNFDITFFLFLSFVFTFFSGLLYALYLLTLLAP